MKNKVFLFIITFLMFGTLNAQFKRGLFELSLSGGLFSSSISMNTPSNTQKVSSVNYVLILSPSYHIFDGISLILDLGINYDKSAVFDGSSVQKLAILNLCYTCVLSESKTAIFIKSGYGLIDNPKYTGQDDNGLINNSNETFRGRVLNIGTGMKFLISDHFSLSAEFNYKNIDWDKKWIVPFTGKEFDYNNTEGKTSFLLGLSLTI